MEIILVNYQVKQIDHINWQSWPLLKVCLLSLEARILETNIVMCLICIQYIQLLRFTLSSINETFTSERLSFLGIWEGQDDWPFSNRIFNYATISKDEYLLIIGGFTGESFEAAESDLVAKFAEGQDAWTVMGRLQQRRYSHGVIGNSDDRILVVGGNNLRFSKLYFC